MKEKLSNSDWAYFIDESEDFNLDKVITGFKAGKYETMFIPSNWNQKLNSNYAGTIWFVKEFQYKSINDKNDTFLLFNGVDYFCDVFLNGHFLGNNEGYFQSFEFNVAKIISKNNILVVRVNSPKEIPGDEWPHKKRLIKGIFNHHDCRPGGWDLERGQDRNTGGIWNDVFILTEKEAYLRNIKVSTHLSDDFQQAGLKIKFDLFNTANIDNIDILIELTQNSEQFLRHSANFKVSEGLNNLEINLKVNNPKLWFTSDIGFPHLYELSISSISFNTYNCSVGFRKVELDENKNFYLNGQRLFLRGTNIIPEQYLSILTEQRIRNQVKLMLDANLNIVRVHAHVNRKEFYDECDRAGLLVWQDFALQWTYSDSIDFAKNAVNQIADMVNQFYNHASIAVWCCHNEPGEQINTLDVQLKKMVDSLEDSRIVRLASNYEEHPYEGWYWGNFEHYIATPMGPLVTEFGAQALPKIETLRRFLSNEEIQTLSWDKLKFHNFQYEQTFLIAGIEFGKDINEFVKNSQAYQAKVIKFAIQSYRSRRFSNNIAGVFQFMFIDCWESITWSVIDYFENKKQGYYALQEAMQPVYPVVILKQHKYFKGGNLSLEITIVNDLNVDLDNLKLNFCAGNTCFHTIDIGFLAKDSVKPLKWEHHKPKLPENLEFGNLVLTAELTTGNRKIAVNSFEVFIVSKPEGLS